MRGPLEKFDLGQLDLVAVVWRTDNAKALVMDPSGQSYIVGNGTRIGKNEGQVISIGDNAMVVKETYVDHLGNKSTKDIEMRIRRSQGG
jgi:Tfp pilus assembly protein PilP